MRSLWILTLATSLANLTSAIPRELRLVDSTEDLYDCPALSPRGSPRDARDVWVQKSRNDV